MGASSHGDKASWESRQDIKDPETRYASVSWVAIGPVGAQSCIPWTNYLRWSWPLGRNFLLTYWGWNKLADIFRRHFHFKIVLKFVPKGPINRVPALDQIMAWRWPGDKPLSEPLMVRLSTHLYICVTLPQWFNMDILLKHPCVDSLVAGICGIDFKSVFSERI